MAKYGMLWFDDAVLGVAYVSVKQSFDLEDWTEANTPALSARSFRSMGSLDESDCVRPGSLAVGSRMVHSRGQNLDSELIIIRFGRLSANVLQAARNLALALACQPIHDQGVRSRVQQKDLFRKQPKREIRVRSYRRGHCGLRNRFSATSCSWL